MEIARSSSSRSGRRCPYCHDALPRVAVTTDCPRCAAAHHPACWDEADGCASCGTALRDTGEAPAPRDGDFDILHVRRRGRPDATPGVSAPSPDRMRVDRTADALTITLPSPRACFQSAFLSVWLCGWLAGELLALGALVAPGIPLPVRAFLLLWLTFWTFGGVTAMGALLNGLGGAAVLRLDHDALTIRKGAFGVPLGRTFTAPLGNLRAVRAAGACVVVEHDGGQFTWEEPTEAEAVRIVELVRGRLDMKG